MHQVFREGDRVEVKSSAGHLLGRAVITKVGAVLLSVKYDEAGKGTGHVPPELCRKVNSDEAVLSPRLTV